MDSLKPVALKFLMKLLGYEDYRSTITKLSPNSQTKPTERDRICRELTASGLVEYDRQITNFSIAPPGKTLLNLDTTSLPVTPDEQKVLRACAKASTTPGKILGVPADMRQDLIRNLEERGLLKVTKEAIKEVRLTPQGKRFLLHEYEPHGSFAAATGSMLGNYVKFLRQNLGNSSSPQHLPKRQPQLQQPLSQPGRVIDTAIPIGSQIKLDRQSVLQQIKQLDQQLNTDNYLPIYHLRDVLQPPLTRSELDSILFALQRDGKIDLDSLHDQGKYTQDQVSAGILQDNGGYLFFILLL
ncbi:MAG: hypothetical protein HC800_17850 [Phormidesmis sp. RL_2_1]|nr:hypothetical protein [Phormidesmis sp. RL_2_1]